MRRFTFILVAFFFTVSYLSSQDEVNSVSFSGETPINAIAGGTLIFDIDLNIVDSLPANLIIGVIKLDADGNPDVQPVSFKVIPLSDVAPYTKKVTDTLSIPDDVILSSDLMNGDTYAVFGSILSATFTPIDQEYRPINVTDISLGNKVGFSRSPFSIAMQDTKTELIVDLNVVDSLPANLMIGLIKLDANGNPDIQPVTFKIIPLTESAPYSKIIADTLSIPADALLSSALEEGEEFAYFCTILTGTYVPVDQEYSEVSIVEKVNSISFYTEPQGSAEPGEEVIVSTGLTVADSLPANLMIGLIKLDADGNPDVQPVTFKIIPLSGKAPYTKLVSDTLSIPDDIALSSTLTEGETYAFFCTILTATFSPIDQQYSDVVIGTTAVHDLFTNNVKIYPNPATERIIIGNDQIQQQIEIYNIDGTLMIKKDLSSNEIDVSGFVPGIYILKGESFVTRFIKQ